MDLIITRLDELQHLFLPFPARSIPAGGVAALPALFLVSRLGRRDAELGVGEVVLGADGDAVVEVAEQLGERVDVRDGAPQRRDLRVLLLVDLQVGWGVQWCHI